MFEELSRNFVLTIHGSIFFDPPVKKSCDTCFIAETFESMNRAACVGAVHVPGATVLTYEVPLLAMLPIVPSLLFPYTSLALDKKVIPDGKEVEIKISGDEMVNAIVALSAWSEVDQSRATTHNKGIMNGIVSAAAAVGQDTRALESGAHSYAAFNRGYAPLSHFEKDDNGNLHGWLEVPIPVGVLGGTIKSNETVRINLEITQCTDPKELAMLLGAVGLAQNLAALRMVAGEGITLGHSELEKERVESVRGSENLIRI